MLEEYDPFAVDYEPDIEVLPPSPQPAERTDEPPASPLPAAAAVRSSEIVNSLPPFPQESLQPLFPVLTGAKRSREYLESEEASEKVVAETVSKEEMPQASGDLPMDVKSEDQKVLFKLNIF